ncbi:MAG: hypothetical protein MI922_26415 [Bacteroidales bacterium]|nr:hypothetical protein [Bacteroidales bacterium]
MSFAGTTMDMIVRFRDNELLRKSRRTRYNRVKDVYQVVTLKHMEVTNQTNITTDEMAVLKDKIRRILRKDRQKQICAIVFSILVGAGLIVYANNLLFGS